MKRFRMFGRVPLRTHTRDLPAHFLTHNRALYELFVEDLNLSRSQLILTFSLLLTYSSDQMIHTGRTIKDVKFVENVHHWCLFAVSIFGWALKEFETLGFKISSAKAIAKGFSENTNLDRKIVCDVTGIKEQDLITSCFVSHLYRPGYFIAIDHSTKTIVIAVRGTFHVRDALTDLIAHYEKFKGGFAHRGFLRAAHNVLEIIKPILESQIFKYPDYGIVVTGHSKQKRKIKNVLWILLMLL